MKNDATQRAIQRELAKRLQKDARPKFQLDKYCFDKQLAFINDASRFKVALCSRRCLAKDTLVKTTYGTKKIQDIIIGDQVYNEFGEPVEVIKTFANGTKTVTRYNFKESSVVCTPDHKFMVEDQHGRHRVVTVGSLSYWDRLVVLDRGRRSSAEITPAESFEVETFDIHVNSFTNLYQLDNGLITHNSGKTVGIAADLINTCNTERDVICAYITLTHANARNIIWNDIVRICDDYQLNVKLDATRLHVYFHDTRSELRLGGAKDENEIEKYRGWKLRKVYIDELQSFRPYVKTLVDKILLPALRDHRGTLGMTGTPGPVPVGFFHDQCHNKNFSQHRWTAFENPHMHSATNNLWDTLREEWLLKGVNESDASVRREDFGEWHEDLQSLVFQFDRVKNVYDTLPDDLLYVLGIDIGWNDSDAIAVVGYSMRENKCYLVNEDIANKQDITTLVEKIKNFQEQYKPVKMVMDAGALGKKIQEEINARHGLFIHAAEKHRKFEYIKLLNDDLRTGRMLCKEGTRFEQDCFLVQWDKTEGHRLAISKSYHTDVGDSLLYSWRECKHYIENAQQRAIPKETDVKYGKYLMEQTLKQYHESQEDKLLIPDLEGFDG